MRCVLPLFLLGLAACSSHGSRDVVPGDQLTLEVAPQDATETSDWGLGEGIDGDFQRSPGELHLELIAPSAIRPQHPFPVVLRVETQGTPAFSLSLTTEVELDGTSPLPLTLHRGVGSATAIVAAESLLRVAIPGGEAERLVAISGPDAHREMKGELLGEDLLWGPEEVIHVTDEVTVAAGETLLIEAGTTVLVDGKKDLVVHGALEISGTASRPVFFAAWSPDKPWGGIRVLGGVATMSYVIATQGGGDASHAFGHSGSQAVLFVDAGQMTLDSIFLVDNVGKGLGAQAGHLDISNSLVSRCDTGGELKQTEVSFFRTWFLEMPSAKGPQVDDDNDGIYLHNPPPELPADKPSATLRECVFSVGKDDGIDHNGARVLVADSFIEGFDHEGIACSKNNWVNVVNTLVRNCQQGIEAGYGSPTVTVSHSTVVGNEVGFRLGDSYERVVSGTLTVVDSIAVDNSQANIWNFSRRDQGPLLGHVDISYSMVDTPEWDITNNNLAGLPLFDDSFHLTSNSLGVGAASDGKDMGLLTREGER